MGILAVKRTAHVLNYLHREGSARFTDLAGELQPISRTSLALLLQTLVAAGELQRVGPHYVLAETRQTLRTGTYALPPALRHATQPILRATAEALGNSCALFGRIGTSTMKILDEHNLPSQTRWQFTPTGYEWPLVPFHGFAQVFLAFGSEPLARDTYYRWRPYLRSCAQDATFRQFRARLARIRRDGYAIEYKQEAETILRLVVPVPLAEETELRLAVGIVARPVYLIDAERGVTVLQQAAAQLARVLHGGLPLLRFAESFPQRETID